MSRTDRAIGIFLGIVVGVAALIIFVFFGSAGSIDAPSLDNQSQSSPAAEQPADAP